MPKYICGSCKREYHGWSTETTCQECGGELVEITDYGKIKTRLSEKARRPS